MENVLPGKIVRQVYLGATRDYLVEVAAERELRVIASAAENIPLGAAVWLYLPPDRGAIAERIAPRGRMAEYGPLFRPTALSGTRKKGRN
jgi:hypothetical protein